VNVIADRKIILQEILKIEDQIKTMRVNPIYLKIKQSIDSLERARGSIIVSIPSPDDPEKILNVRYHSREMRETISRYRERQIEFDVQMDDLYVQKARLQKQLFEYTA